MNRAAGYPQDIRGKGNNAQRNTVRVAKERLLAAKKFRNLTREEIWEANERQYEGHHWEQTPEGQDLIVVNYSFGNVNVIVPYVTGSEPNYLVRPFGNGATPMNAAKQQAFLNRQWRHPDVAGQESLEDAAVDFVIYGDGYVKTGYSIGEKRVDSADRSYAEVAELWVARVDPWDIWIDPTSDGLHNARFVVNRFRMTREELEASGFSNTDDDNVTFGQFHRVEQNEHSNSARRRLGVREAMDGVGEYAILYEYFDFVKSCRVVFTEEGQSPLAYDEDVPRSPIVQIPNYRIPGSPYHMGELEQVWGIQQELNKTRSQMISHRARNVQKFGAKRGLLDDTAKLALRSSIVNEVVEVDSDLPLNEIVVPFAVPNLTADAYNLSDVMISDLYEISGITELMRGAAPDIRKSATEVTIMEGASNIKAQHKLRRIERAAKKIGELILGFAADVFPLTDYDEVSMFVTGKEAEAIARNDPAFQAPEGGLAGVEFSPGPDMWSGEYEVYVEQASTELRNPVVREQKFRQLVFDLVGLQEALAAQGKMLDIQHLVSLWLEAAGIEDPDSMFLELPPPALEPGRIDVEMGDFNNPELLGPLLEGAGLGDFEDLMSGMAPDEVPPDMSMGSFGPDNTGALEPV